VLKPFPFTDADLLPQEACRFQHWGERDGAPFSDIRPLTDAAAERVWARVAPRAGASAIDTGASDTGLELDLNMLDDWDAATVKAWLLALPAVPGERVLVCDQPQVAVSVPWAAVCEHWLVFFWTGACVCDCSGKWVLVHDGDAFRFIQSGVSRPAAVFP
jgi:hypothetical protein